MAKLVILNGSPREGGNTDMLLTAFKAGLERENNEIVELRASKLNISPCKGCNACQSIGRCVIRDDMDAVVEELSAADIIVFATPVYFFTESSHLKLLIDRLHTKERARFKVKKLALLAVGASVKSYAFDAIAALYDTAVAHFNLENAGKLFVYGVKDKGDIRDNPALKTAYMLGKGIFGGKSPLTDRYYEKRA